VVARHAQRIDGQERFAARERAELFVDPGHREQRPARQGHARRTAAHQAGDLAQHFGQRHVLSAQHIAAPVHALFQRGEVPGGDILDMDEVEPAVDIGGHAPVGRLDDDPARGGGAQVARADRGRGIDDHGGEPARGHGLFDQAFGDNLGALVGPHHGLFGGRVVFVRRAPVEREERGDRTGVDQPLDPAGERRLDHVVGGEAVVAHDFFGIGRPEAIVRRDVEGEAHAFHRAAHARAIAQVALDDVEAQPGQIFARGGAAHEDAAPRAPGEQRAHHRRTEEPAGTRHQDQVVAIGHEVSL
jgi:hypothetical protein